MCVKTSWSIQSDSANAMAVPATGSKPKRKLDMEIK
ncbi:hypothetical protein OKW38_003477 [Paraburkholderia sp. MM5496-R1]|uniref:Uncharacterized protein n=1 Tax=Paraburkholderia tuberum TaxID=157910 RepID=A0A1H1EBR3_9BURK|nr:hypothetical protein SAMN05445850_1945 [Paraburkholderia tuberum]